MRQGFRGEIAERGQEAAHHGPVGLPALTGRRVLRLGGQPPVDDDSSPLLDEQDFLDPQAASGFQHQVPIRHARHHALDAQCEIADREQLSELPVRARDEAVQVARNVSGNETAEQRIDRLNEVVAGVGDLAADKAHDERREGVGETFVIRRMRCSQRIHKDGGDALEQTLFRPDAGFMRKNPPAQLAQLCAFIAEQDILEPCNFLVPYGAE